MGMYALKWGCMPLHLVAPTLAAAALAAAAPAAAALGAAATVDAAVHATTVATLAAAQQPVAAPSDRKGTPKSQG